MASTRKIRANRVNARASTGPKLRRVAPVLRENAIRHGLSVPIGFDPLLSEEVDALASKIAGLHAKPEIREHARRVAEAEIDLLRIRAVRHQLVNGALCDLTYEDLKLGAGKS